MRQLKHFLITGILFVFISGSLSHFLYGWSGDNPFVGFFSPVNESIWEHMKLLFFPMLAYMPILICKFRDKYPGIIPALCVGILAGTFFIPIFYYAYTYVCGKDIFLLDIAAFVLSILIAFWLTYRLAPSTALQPHTLPLVILVFLLFVCFMTFTYYPPDLALFEDPAKPSSVF